VVTSDASFAARYLEEVAAIARQLDADAIERMAAELVRVRDAGGRLFIIGVGGGAGHASHAVNDFRKLCGIEAYAPTDNVSELTARVNDEGWDTAYREWLRGSRLGTADAVLVFSVGGGSREHGLSVNLVEAVELAKEVGAAVLAVVGRMDGTAARLADACVVIAPTPDERRTPHVEAFQAVVWHLLVSHPSLASQPGTWEQVERAAAKA
jgi:D-sedoheptulose 7-phosphate isomerase